MEQHHKQKRKKFKLITALKKLKLYSKRKLRGKKMNEASIIRYSIEYFKKYTKQRNIKDVCEFIIKRMVCNIPLYLLFN